MSVTLKVTRWSNGFAVSAGYRHNIRLAVGYADSMSGASGRCMVSTNAWSRTLKVVIYRKRRTIRRFRAIHTLRNQFINRAGFLVQPNGRSTLDVGNNSTVRERFQAVERALAA